MSWPDFGALWAILSLNVLLIILTFGTAMITFLWQHDDDLKNPTSRKSMIIIGTCLLAGLVSILNAVHQDRDAAVKDSEMALLTSEITGYRTAILSQAIRASSTPAHAMFVFHPKGVDYNRDLKDIDFEVGDPDIKLFFYQPLLATGSMAIDINTLFRYQLNWQVKRSSDGAEIVFDGARKEIWDRLGADANNFDNVCFGEENCTMRLDPDGESGEKDEAEINPEDSNVEGRFGGIGGNYDGIFAISLTRNITWSDIVRAAGAPFQSSAYGKGAYGAMRFEGVGSEKLDALREVLSHEGLYFGFEFLSKDKERPGCMMARLPVKLEFWRFERAKGAGQPDVAAFMMKPNAPSMEIVDCADHSQI